MDILMTGTSSRSFISSAERPPHAMGFRLLDDDEQPHALDPVFNRDRAEGVAAPIAPEDEELIRIDVENVQIDQQQGAEIPQGRVEIWDWHPECESQ